MTLYCAGFLLDGQGRVVLVRKNRPRWQAGRLNAVGGHVEDGETPVEAQRREFREETGVDVPEPDWHHFATVSWGAVSQDSEPGEVQFFRCFRPALELYDCRTVEDEQVGVYFTSDLHKMNVMPNLKWLVPLAEYTHDFYAPVVAAEVSR